MPDENEQTENAEETEVKETEGTEEVTEETEAENAKETEETNKESEDDDLPDWARTKLTKANNEAASYRTKLREAEQKLQSAKSLEEVDEIIANLKSERETTERALLIENVALRNGLPKELAELLKGSTREELEAHALVLKKFAPSEDDDEDIELEGGLNPRSKDPEANLSPRELAQRFGRGSKRRR